MMENEHGSQDTNPKTAERLRCELKKCQLRRTTAEPPRFHYVVRNLHEGVVCTSFKRAAVTILASDESDGCVDEFWRVMRSEAEPADNTLSESYIVHKSNAATLKEYARFVAIMNQLPESERYHVDAFEVV